MPKIRLLSHSPKHRAHTDKRYRNNKWRKFYGSKLWRDLREQKLYEQPICERCLEQDRITPATDVHHITPFGLGIDEQQMWELFLDYDNLMSVCKRCHREIHGNYDHS